MENLAPVIAEAIQRALVVDPPLHTIDTRFEVTIHWDGQELRTDVRWQKLDRRMSTTSYLPLDPKPS